MDLARARPRAAALRTRSANPRRQAQPWAIRARLQMENHVRELALFDLGIDSKLRACGWRIPNQAAIGVWNRARQCCRQA
jgi:hypothetical protein